MPCITARTSCAAYSCRFLTAFRFVYLEDEIQTCKPQYLAHSQGRVHQPQISTSRLERYQGAYSRRINCSYAAEVQNDISPMLLNDRAQQRSFLAANESALTAHSHDAACTFNGYVQNSSILSWTIRIKKD